MVSCCLDKLPEHRPAPAEVIELCRQESTGARSPMAEDWLPRRVAVAVDEIAEARVPAVPRQASVRRWPVVLLAAAGAAIMGAAAVLVAMWSGVIGVSGGASLGSTGAAVPAASMTTGMNRDSKYLGQYDLNLSEGYGIVLGDPTKLLSDGGKPDPDLWFSSDGGLFYNRNADRAVVLPGNETPGYQPVPPTPSMFPTGISPFSGRQLFLRDFQRAGRPVHGDEDSQIGQCQPVLRVLGDALAAGGQLIRGPV